MSGQQVRRLSAAGYSTWVFLDTRRKWFGASVSVKLSSGASLTYSVQHTFDNLRDKFEDFTATRSGTTVTVTKTNHGLSAGDYVYQESSDAPFDGDHNVATVTNANVFTYTVANSGATTSNQFGKMATARVFPHAVLAALTASADSNYVLPPAASRLYISTYSSGFADETLLQQGA